MLPEPVQRLSLAIAIVGFLGIVAASIPRSVAFGWRVAGEAAGGAVVAGDTPSRTSTFPGGAGRDSAPEDTPSYTPHPQPTADVTPAPGSTAVTPIASESPAMSPGDEVGIASPAPSPPAEPRAKGTGGDSSENAATVTITPAPAPTRAPIAEKEPEAATDEAATAVTAKNNGAR
jgi:hypothetical protein